MADSQRNITKEDELQSELDKVKITDSIQDGQENGNKSTITVITTNDSSSAQNPRKKKKKKNKKKKSKVPSLSCPVQEKLETTLLDFINQCLSNSNSTPSKTIIDLHELTLEKLKLWPNLESSLKNLLDIFLSTDSGSSPPKSLCRSKMTVTLPKADDTGPGLLENVSATSQVPPLTRLINQILTARCRDHFDLDNKYCIFPTVGMSCNNTNTHNSSNTETVSMVKSIIRQSLQSSPASSPHYFILINIEDFYESVSHDVLVDAFTSQAKPSLPPSYLQYIKNYLSLSTSVVTVAEWNVDQELHEDSGLISLGEDCQLQNDGLCTFLFNLVMKQILGKIEKGNESAAADTDENFIILPHLNSILVKGKNRDDVSKILESFVSSCSSFGLEVDAGECQSLSLDSKGNLTPQFTINNVKISAVNLVTFLKTIVNSSP